MELNGFQLKTPKVQKRNKSNSITKKRTVGDNLTVFFFNNVFYVDYKNRFIKIHFELEDINKVNVLYSLPDNTYWENWYVKTKDKDVIIDKNTYKFWHIIRPWIKIKGKIINDEFYIDFEDLNIQNEKRYKKYHNTLKKNNDTGIRKVHSSI